MQFLGNGFQVMGKRRFEEVVDVDPSETDDSISRLKKKKKKKNLEINGNGINEDDCIRIESDNEADKKLPKKEKKKYLAPVENGDIDDSFIEEIEALSPPVKKRRVVKEEENEEDDVIEYWILRKPKQMKMEDIPLKIKFPKKSVTKEASYRARNSEAFISANFHPTKKQTYLIDRKKIKESSNGKKKVKPYEMATGMVTMAYEDDDNMIAPIPPDEDFLHSHIDENRQMEHLFDIKVIRKAPKVLKDVVERNKAFGVIKKEKHRK